MVSEYLKPTRSLEELLAIMDSHYRASAAIARTAFNQEVTAAITSITEITQITTARVQADGQVASAKIASDAEIASISLLANAEIAALEIQERRLKTGAKGKQANAMAVEICRSAKAEINATAQQSVDEIQAQAQKAIMQIAETGKKAIEDIQSFSLSIKQKMDDNEALFRKRLEESVRQKAEKKSPEDQDDKNARAVEEAEEAEVKLQADLATSLDELKLHVEVALKQINELTDEALSTLKAIVKDASDRIFGARDRASAKVDDLLKSVV